MRRNYRSHAVKPPSDEKPRPFAATLLADDLEATEIPDAELASGAAGPMVGTFATTGVIQLVQAVIGVLLARILGPADRGELAAVILWPTLLTVIGSIGIAQSSTYHAARASRLGLVVGSTLVIIAVDSMLLVALGWVILPLALGGHDPQVVHDGQLFLTAFVPLNLLVVSMLSILNGNHQFAWFQSLRLVLIGATALGIGLLAATGQMTVASAACAYVAANFVTAALALAVTFRPPGERSLPAARPSDPCLDSG